MNNYLRFAILFVLAVIIAWKVHRIVWKASRITAATTAVLHRLDKSKYTVFNDVCFPSAEGKDLILIDHVVASVYGLVAVKTMEDVGEIIGKETDEEWTRVLFGRQKKIANPIKENLVNVRELQDLLRENGYPRLPIFSIVVFANSFDLHIEAEKYHVVPYKELNYAIQKRFQKDLIHPTALKQLVMDLEYFGALDGSTKAEQLIDKWESDQRKDKKISRGFCPKCGKKLVLMHEKQDDYYRCSGYPECDFTADTWQVKKKKS